MTVLYHYCSTSSFVSIISSRSIWLSSLNLSNDTMEGKLVAETLKGLASRDDLDQEIISTMQKSIAISEKSFHGLGFCLSEKGDLLSQWRGYAVDGTGFSIGFSKQYFLTLLDSLDELKSFSLEKVLYNAKDHEKAIRPTYNKVKEMVDNGVSPDWYATIEGLPETPNSLFLNLFALSFRLYTLKTVAFREEKEWRLISHLVTSLDLSCDFHSLYDRIVPHKVLNLNMVKDEPIVEVIIGPKNLTPSEVVETLLKKHGFSDVKISRSSATYR